MPRYKLLIVDDSLVIRSFLRECFAPLPDFEVIGAAADPYAARDIMSKNWPDVITLDIEMPRMNGIEFLRKVMRARPTPVVMMSTLTRKGAAITMEALEIGAYDYVAKPQVSIRTNLETVRNEIIAKVRHAVTANIVKQSVTHKKLPVLESRAGAETLSGKVVLVGASTGGVQALTQIFSRLPKEVPGIAVVQHMPPTFIDSLAEQLARRCQLEVRVAEDAQPFRPGTISVAPGDRHLEVLKHSNGFYARLVKGEPIGFHMPAVNALFASAARIGGKEILGVILTGMGEDGAAGMLEMRRRGCRTIGQNKESCIVYGMPRKAYEIGAVESQLPLNEIADGIVAFAGGVEPRE